MVKKPEFKRIHISVTAADEKLIVRLKKKIGAVHTTDLIRQVLRLADVWVQDK